MATKTEERFVELGFVADETDESSLRSQFFPSKVGGRPAWLHLSSLPSADDLRCRVCGKPSIFLLQIYAPIEGNPQSFHRTLFVFVCRDANCCKPNDGLNFIVFRSQLPRKNPFYSFEPPDYSGKDNRDEKLTDAADFQDLCVVCGCVGSKCCGGCKTRTFCSKEHQKIDWSLGGHKGSCGKDAPSSIRGNDAFLFPTRQIETEPEDESDAADAAEDEPEVDGEKEMEQLKDLPGDELADPELEAMAARETPEQRIFSSFKKRVSKAPEQILRYCRGGEPLWIAESPSHPIPPCEYCGGPRTFELQIMPQLLTHLNVDDVGKSIDWGVLAIFSCQDSCDILLSDTSGSAAASAAERTTQIAYKKEYLVKQDVTI